MVVSVEVSGAEQFRALGARLRRAGSEGRGLRLELLRNIRATAQPLTEETKQAAREELPHGGGTSNTPLNEWVANGATVKVRNRMGGFNAGVRIRATKGKSDLRRIDKGSVRHPVFGNRNVWRANSVTPGWFSETLKKSAPAIRIAIFAAMAETSRKIKGI